MIGDNISETSSNKQADVFCIHPRITDVCSPASKMVFIHVDNAPDIDFRFIRTGVYDEAGDIVFENRYYFDATVADANAVELLRQNREITIEWSRAIQLIKDKTTGEQVWQQ